MRSLYSAPDLWKEWAWQWWSMVSFMIIGGITRLRLLPVSLIPYSAVLLSSLSTTLNLSVFSVHQWQQLKNMLSTELMCGLLVCLWISKGTLTPGELFLLTHRWTCHLELAARELWFGSRRRGKLILTNSSGTSNFKAGCDKLFQLITYCGVL